MLQEIDISEIPEPKKFIAEPTETSRFCEKTLLDFMKSSIKTAEVTGWPNGEPATARVATSYLSSLKSKIHGMKLEDVDAIMRGKRIFVMKTIISKVGENND